MFLLYCDASGTPELTDHSLHYVLLGVCVPESAWFSLNTRIRSLKESYCQSGWDLELHAAQFTQQIREQEAIDGFEDMSWSSRRAVVEQLFQEKIAAAESREKRSKMIAKFDRLRPYLHLSRLQRSKLLTDTLELVGEQTGIKLFAEAVSKTHPEVISKTIDPVCQAFEQVVTRFDFFLQDYHQWKLNKWEKPKRDNGLLILDEDHSKESLIARHFSKIRESEPHYLHGNAKLQHVVDVPFYAASDQLAGLQLADICAYALRRYLDKGAISGSHEETNLRKIFHKFDQSEEGQLYGIRHFVPPGTCKCIICLNCGSGT